MTYATGVALFGGTTQPVLKLLIDATGSAFAPPWYVMAALTAGSVGVDAVARAR